MNTDDENKVSLTYDENKVKKLINDSKQQNRKLDLLLTAAKKQKDEIKIMNDSQLAINRHKPKKM